MIKPKTKTIKIEKFEFPASNVSPIEPLVYAYDTMPIVDDNPRVIITGREVKTTLNRVKLLKALVQSSVNRNEEYGMLMAKAMTSVIKSIASGEDLLVIPMSPDANKLETLIVSSINEFIQKKVDININIRVMDYIRYQNTNCEDWFKEEVLDIDIKREVLNSIFRNYSTLRVNTAYYGSDNLCLDRNKTTRCFVSPNRKANKCHSFNLNNDWVVQSSALTFNNGIIEDSIIVYNTGNSPTKFVAYYAVYESTTDTYQYYKRIGLDSVLEECTLDEMVAGKS